MANNQVVVANKQKLRDFLNNERFQNQVAAVLPTHLTPQRMASLALLACTQTPKLLECTPASVIRSVMAASISGLEFNGPLGHAYLVPFGAECQFIPGYRGLIDLVVRGGGAIDVQAHIVYACDEFDIGLGSKPFIHHKPDYKARETASLGDAFGAYMYAVLPGGGVHTDFMPRKQILRRKAMSKASRSDSPWKVWEDEMWRKTPVRNGVKYLPISNERIALRLGAAVEFGDRVDTGEINRLIPEFDDEASIEEALATNGNGKSSPEPSGTPLGQRVQPESNADPLTELVTYMKEIVPDGGDALHAQRKVLTERAEKLFGEGSDELAILFSLAGARDLGKNQAGRLVTLTDAAIAALPKP